MTDEPRQGTRPRWLVVALVASLGLNLAVAGLVAGIAWHGPPPPGGRGDGLWRYGADLPEPFRRDLGRAMRDGRGDWRGPHARLRAQREALAEALETEPYDPAAVVRVLRNERDLFDALANSAATLLLEQIARMAPRERATYAEALRRDDRDRPPR